jgi:hypothetical protein
MTEKYKRLALLWTCLSVLLLVGPFTYYTITALVGAALVSQKVALCSTLLIVGIMTVIAAANKTVLRSRLWILLIGLYVCLNNILTPLLIIAVCQVLDELVVAPLAKHYRNKLTISKTLDERLN